MPWATELGASAERFIMDNVFYEKALARIEACCEMLAAYPDAGSPYDPFGIDDVKGAQL